VPDELGVPDSTEPLLGWRVWHLDLDGLLKPIVANTEPWAPGSNIAHCHLAGTTHTAPGRGCVCGFNALHKLPDEFRGDPGHAIGVIAAWGTVDVYETGFRSEYAAVVGLLDDAGSGLHQRKLERAAEVYGVKMLDLWNLKEHVKQFGSSVSPMLMPGVPQLDPFTARSRSLTGTSNAGRSNVPLPSGAMPDKFKGRGVLVNNHLAVDHDGRSMRLGPTPSLGALAIDGIEPAVEVGQEVGEGEALFVAEAASSVIVVPSPVTAKVVRVNENGAVHADQGPAAGGWLIELRLQSESLDATSIAWGRRGAEAYREFVLAAGSDADLLLRGASSPRPTDGLVDEEDAYGWLRAFAQLLDASIRAEEQLCAALRSLEGPAAEVVFEVAGVEELRIAPPPVGSDRWVRAGAAPEDGFGRSALEPLAIELSPRALQAYWRGDIGLAPDDVSLAGEPVQRPLHVIGGDRGELRIANSLHRRVFTEARRALDGLGDPWFRAGDAVRDPVENLRVLAGFQPPSGLGRSAA